MPAQSPTQFWCYIGSTAGKIPAAERGIYVCRFDSQTGSLSDLKLAVSSPGASFLAIHPSRKFVFATAEVGKAGGVAGFRIDHSSGKLAPINQQPSGGSGPCHVSLDSTGTTLLVANYGSGSVASLPVGDDGSLGAAVSMIQNHGSGPTRRQEGPHAHFIAVDPTNRFALSCDLGIDQVLLFHLDAKTASLTPAQQLFASVPPGAGPRHLAFHPNGKFVYVVNELGNTVTVFAWDAGKMTQLQDISALPADFKGESYTAEIRVHPNCKFVYVSNRGHNSIALFKILDSGQLAFIGTEPCGGDWPRNFEIDPTGRWLIVANEKSNDLQVFAIDPETGQLKRGESQLKHVPAPSCVRFLPTGE